MQVSLVFAVRMVIPIAFLSSLTSAHIQMSDPYPIRSPLNRLNELDGTAVYNYTNPLASSGGDYPCKGYAGDPWDPTATYVIGKQYTMKLSGNATHEGGSCQIALSYDGGKAFRVIKSILGGCPLAHQYSFTIPRDASSGNALLAWTWFNKVGNREMYMNCAQVVIKEGEYSQSVTKFHDRPEIFLANINAEGNCTTDENQEVNFPRPGDEVEGTVAGTGYLCTGWAPFLMNESVASALSSPSSSSSSPSSSQRPSNGEPSSLSSPSPSSSAAVTVCETTTSSGQGQCDEGSIFCSDNQTSFSVCDHGLWTPMGPVAEGTVCKNGMITASGGAHH